MSKDHVLKKDAPLTKYFQVVPNPRSLANKENQMLVSKSKDNTQTSTPNTRRTWKRKSRGSRGSTPCSPIDCITLSSDEDIFISPKRGKLTIKDLFNDQVKTKPVFPPVESSALPHYLKYPSPTSSSDGSDQDLPSFLNASSLSNHIEMSPNTVPVVESQTALAPPITPLHGNLEKLKVTSPLLKEAQHLFKSTVDPCCLVADPVCSENELIFNEEEEMGEEREDGLEEALENLTLTETKQLSLDIVTSCRGLTRNCKKVFTSGRSVVHSMRVFV